MESEGQARARNQVNAVRDIRTESINSVNVEPCDIEYQNAKTHEPHNRVSGRSIVNTLFTYTMYIYLL